jgi:AraC-like DNA-binding protein
MAGNGQPPRLARRIGLARSSKSRTTLGTCDEVYNFASPQARRLWYYLRVMGRVTHPAGWKNEHHGRDGVLLHVVRRGELWHDIKQTRYCVRRGQACLLDLRHDVTYGVAGIEKAEFDWAWINGKDMPTVFLELGADQDPIFPLRDPARVGSLLQELRSLTLREVIGYEVRSSGLITMILAELFTSRAGRAKWFSLGEDARPLSDPVRKAIDFMTLHYDSAIAVKYVAGAIAKLSLSHFSRRFHREVGVSPVAYLNRFRIEQAKKFLTGSSQSVAQIARSLGYANPHYFTRTFTRIAGVAPLVYRKHPRRARQS